MKNEEALNILRNTWNLTSALEATHTSSELLGKYMEDARMSLRKAVGIASEGTVASEDFLHKAEALCNLANNLYDDFESKLKPRRRFPQEKGKDGDMEAHA